MGKITLRKIELSDEHELLKAVTIFEEQEDEFEFLFDFDKSRPFSEYYQKVKGWEKSINLKEVHVPATMLIAFNEKNELVGRVSIRHELNDFLSRIGGHVGYMVMPAHRKQGYGRSILAEGLNFIRENLTLNKLLITCDEDNIGSVKIIENDGGIFEGLYQDETLKVAKKRYWITL